jgi:hypothetical protein
LGHTFGRHHPGFCGQDASDPDFPYPNGQIGDGSDGGYFGLNVGDPGNSVPRNILLPTSTFDVMTYCLPEWLSAYTYDGIRRRLLDENRMRPPPRPFLSASNSGLVPQSLLDGDPGSIAMLTGPKVHVSAIVNLTGGTGTIEFVTPVQRAAPQVGVTDRAVLVVRDGSGRKLSRTPVVLHETTDIASGEDQTALVDAVQ